MLQNFVGVKSDNKKCNFNWTIQYENWYMHHVLIICIFISCPHSGYDFGYLVKLLTDSRLPEEEHEFFQILNLFFPAIYDVKYLMKSCKNLKVCTVPVTCVVRMLYILWLLKEDCLFLWCLGWTSGGGGPAGAQKDRQAASGRLRLSAHWNGFLPHERGLYWLNNIWMHNIIKTLDKSARCRSLCRLRMFIKRLQWLKSHTGNVCNCYCNSYSNSHSFYEEPPNVQLTWIIK